MHRRWIVIIVLMFRTTAVSAGEPYERFLDGLRSERLFDQANFFLKQIEADPNLPAEVRMVLPYQKALLLMEAAREAPSPEERRQFLKQAQAAFEQFVKGAKADHPQLAEANSTRARLLIEEAQTDLWEADSPANAAQKDVLRKRTRDSIEKARAVFSDAANQHKAAWTKFPTFIPEVEKATRERRAEAEGRYLESQLETVKCDYWEAQSYERGSRDWGAALDKAANGFAAIESAHGNQLAGLYAQLWRGKCYEELGGKENLGRAIGIYNQMIESAASDPALRGLRDKALDGTSYYNTHCIK